MTGSLRLFVFGGIRKSFLLFPLDDERAAIIVLNQWIVKILWKTTVVDSGNIVP
jgi:hypothetical protein